MLSSGPLRLALLCALLAVGAMVGTTAASRPPASPSHRAASEPRCFGAASLDPSKPCHNPRLARLVVPPPAVARHRPNAPCTVIGVEDSLKLCAFGAPRTHASATVALVGDSHAENWRGAVAHVARAKGWYGISIALGGSPYSSITRPLDEPLRSHCAECNR